MKHILFILVALGFSVKAFSQTDYVAPKNIDIKKNAIGEFSLSIDIGLDIDQSETIDTDYWIENPQEKPKVSLLYSDQKLDCPLNVLPTLGAKSVGFKVTNFSKSTFDRFLNKDRDNQIKLIVEQDVKIRLLADGQTEQKFLVIKADVLNSMINEQLTYTEDDRTGFMTSLNNFYYYDNKADFGVNPGQDSIKTNYILSLKLQNAYNRKSFLKCDDNTKSLPVYWNLDARVSTNFKDSLNYIKFYPINLMIENFTKKIPYQLNLKLGHESTQDFIRKRAVIDASISLITPNLVNLSTAQSNRLRLKPVITAGLKGYYDYSNNVDSFASGQPHIDGYYYIPVFDNYAIIFEGTSFYDLSQTRNPNKKIQGNYSITLGAEIPKTGFKAMFKYTDGRTDINFKQGSIIAIGLLMDFFDEKK